MPSDAEQIKALEGMASEFDDTIERGVQTLQRDWTKTYSTTWRAGVDDALATIAAAPTKSAKTGAAVAQSKALAKQLKSFASLTKRFGRVLDDITEQEERLAQLARPGATLDAAELRAKTITRFADGVTERADRVAKALRAGGLTDDKALLDELESELRQARASVELSLAELPMRYSREVAREGDADAGFTRYLYLGPDDSRNRRFCKLRVGKSYTREEIDAMRNPSGTDVWTTCGGWRCRHHWRPDPAALDEAP